MPLISNKLVSQYAQLHETKTYGVSSHEFLLQLQICLLDLKPDTVLEYGCGQSKLCEMLALEEIEWIRYDPAIPEYSKITIDRSDFVVNTDVMEHIPEEDVNEVLEHIKSLTDNVFFNISTRPANQVLPNGENAHCTVWPDEKWLQKISQHFPSAQIVYSRIGDSCIIITWSSTIGKVISAIEYLKQTDCITVRDHFFKRAERNSRTQRIQAASNHQFSSA